MRMLLVDDEKGLLGALRQLFTEQHYQVDTAKDGVTGYEKASSNPYDVVVLDVMMPGMSGYDVVKRLRADGHSMPILLLTAKDAVDDRVNGLDCGADDYLVKPFATRELLARVRALTRRTGEVLGTETLEVGAFKLDLVARSVTLGEAPLILTSREFQLLEFFLRNPGRVLPKELILDRVWGYESAIDTNSVETYVHFLRRKIDAHCAAIGLCRRPVIETVRGVGYTLKGI